MGSGPGPTLNMNPYIRNVSLDFGGIMKVYPQNNRFFGDETVYQEDKRVSVWGRGGTRSCRRKDQGFGNLGQHARKLAQKKQARWRWGISLATKPTRNFRPI